MSLKVRHVEKRNTTFFFFHKLFISFFPTCWLLVLRMAMQPLYYPTYKYQLLCNYKYILEPRASTVNINTGHYTINECVRVLLNYGDYAMMDNLRTVTPLPIDTISGRNPYKRMQVLKHVSLILCNFTVRCVSYINLKSFHQTLYPTYKCSSFHKSYIGIIPQDSLIISTKYLS